VEAIVALITSAGGWAILLGVLTPVGAGLGPPLSLLPFCKFSAADAAVWGLTFGVATAILAIVILPKGVV
jgi:hypothetical protein